MIKKKFEKKISEEDSYLYSLSIEDLMYLLNKKFINSKATDKAPSYVISNTLFDRANKKFVICDSRMDSEDEWSELQYYYGATIKQALINTIKGENIIY